MILRKRLAFGRSGHESNGTTCIIAWTSPGIWHHAYTGSLGLEIL